VPIVRIAHDMDRHGAAQKESVMSNPGGYRGVAARRWSARGCRKEIRQWTDIETGFSAHAPYR